jgi:hypothetical protein
MRFIKPAEIASRIMSLMDEAENTLIIISPYNKIAKWEKMRRLLMAVSKRIDVEYYIRARVPGNRKEITSMGINPVEIDNLHAKVYMNERSAIVTSMNLNESSDIQSLDIGFETENSDEFEHVKSFYRTHIRPRRGAILVEGAFRAGAVADQSDCVSALQECLHRGMKSRAFERRG